MNSVGKLIAGMLAVILLFLYPLQYVADNYEHTLNGVMKSVANEFITDTKEQNQISLENYEHLINQLDQTGEKYQIQLEAVHPVTGKELMIKKQQGFLYAGYIIPNNEIMSYAVPTHVHTEDCYEGHRHSEAPPIDFFTHKHAHGNSCKEYVRDIYSEAVCSECGKTVLYTVWSAYWNTTYDCVMPALDSLTLEIAQEESNNHYCLYCKKNGVTRDNGKSHSYIGYSCGYNSMELTGEVKSGSTVTYQYGKVSGLKEYQRNRPQEGTLENNYYSGCYKFHVRKVPVDTYSNRYKQVPSYIRDSIYNNDYEYCYLPEYFRVKYYFKYRFEDGETIDYGDDGPSSAYYQEILYYVKVDENGEIYCEPNKKQFDLWYIYRTYRYVNGAYVWDNLYPKSYTLPDRIPLKDFFERIVYDGDAKKVITFGKNANDYKNIQEEYLYYFTTSVCTCIHCINRKPINEWVLDCEIPEDESLDCDRVVVDISATAPVQTINMGESIVSTATATYLDGHTGIINCNVSGFEQNKVGTQTVTLSYTGLVDTAKNRGTKSTTIRVTVKSNKILTKITATTNNNTITRYHDLNPDVTAYYDDGTSKKVTTYMVSGFDNKKIGKQTVTISYQENGKTSSTTIMVTVEAISKACSICGNQYYYSDTDTDEGCPNCSNSLVRITTGMNNMICKMGQPLQIEVIGHYMNGHTAKLVGWASDYNPNVIGSQGVTITYHELSTKIVVTVVSDQSCSICGKLFGEAEYCTDCHSIAVSLVVTPNVVTIYEGDTLPLTVLATFKDGTCRTVLDWETDRADYLKGIYNVKIRYQSLEEEIRLIVLGKEEIECSICGTIYDGKEYPDGCPICSKEVQSLEVNSITGNRIYIGNALTLTVLVVYRDQHKEEITSGYDIFGFDSSKLGVQQVTVHYKGVSAMLEIEIINGFRQGITCPFGHFYYINEDGVDNGCPFCKDIVRDKAIFYFDIDYTNEILHKLYTEGTYPLQEGDYFIIRITCKKTSAIEHMKSLFSNRNKKIQVIVGGEIR